MTTQEPPGVNTEKVQRRTRPLALLRPLLRALCVSLLVVRGEAMSWAPRLHATRWVHHRMPTTPQKRINVIRKLLMTTDDRAADYSYDVATLDAPPDAHESDEESVTIPAAGGFGSFLQGLFAPVSAQAAAVVDQPIPIASSIPEGMDPIQVR